MRYAKTLLVVGLASAVALAQAGGAVVAATGSVSVNGSPVSKSAAVNAGDKIQTGQSGTASITANGAAATLANKTSGVVGEQDLSLEQGTAAITTTSGFAVRAGALTVAPQEKSAKFEVSRLSCRVTVAARQGVLALSDGTVVKQGESVVRPEPSCVAGTGNSNAGQSAAGMSNAKAVGIAAGVAAAASTAAYVSVQGQERKASPSRP